MLGLLRALRQRAHAQRLARSGGGAAAIRAWRSRHDETVVAGPFRGMRYPARWGDASTPAKWLGSYEEELAPTIAELIGRNPALVVVIGSADGYYSVGVARALPAARVEAFDSEWLARRNTRRLAHANGVAGRVFARGTATTSGLAAVLGSAPRRALVISDCEGAEDELIDPSRVPALAGCDLIVELHESEDPSLGERIAARFPAHRSELITTRDRDTSRYPQLAALDAAHRPFLVREYRLKQRYLVLVAPR